MIYNGEEIEVDEAVELLGLKAWVFLDNYVFEPYEWLEGYEGEDISDLSKQDWDDWAYDMAETLIREFQYEDIAFFLKEG